MIASLNGKVIEIRADSIVLDVNGVGYLVYVPSSLLFALENNQDLFLLIESITKDTGTTLYGFKEKGEKDVFELLITVQGVGPKIAIAALSTFGYSQIVSYISLANSKALQQISGVGAKAASRLVNELKDKVAKLNIDFNLKDKSRVKHKASLEDDLFITLTSLGYKENEVQKAIESITIEDYKEHKLQEAVKDALRYFAD